HDRYVGAGRQRAKAANELRAVQLGHLEIGDDEVGGLGPGIVQRPRRMVEGGRQALEDLQVGDPVVDDGYGLTFHALSDPSWSWPVPLPAQAVSAGRRPRASRMRWPAAAGRPGAVT